MSELPTYEQIAGWLGPEWTVTRPAFDGPSEDWWVSLPDKHSRSLYLRHSSGQRVVVKAPEKDPGWHNWFRWIRNEVRGVGEYAAHVTWLDEPEQAKCAACGEEVFNMEDRHFPLHPLPQDTMHPDGYLLCEECWRDPGEDVDDAIRAGQSPVVTLGELARIRGEDVWFEILPTDFVDETYIGRPLRVLQAAVAGSVQHTREDGSGRSIGTEEDTKVRRVPPPGEQHEKASGKEGVPERAAREQRGNAVPVHDGSGADGMLRLDPSEQAPSDSGVGRSGRASKEPATWPALPAPALTWCEARLAEQLATGGRDTQYERDRLVMRWKAGQELERTFTVGEDLKTGIASLRLERPLISWKRRK